MAYDNKKKKKDETMKGDKDGNYMSHDDDMDDDEKKKKKMKDMKEKKEKSLLDEDELQKSITQLEEIASNSTPESRKEALLNKALGTGLTSEENDELYALQGGAGTEEPEEFSRSIESNFEDEDLSKAFNVSPAMEAQTGAIVKSLGQMSDRIDQGSKRQHDFNIALAKAVAQSGGLTLEMKKSLEKVLEVPIEQPKAAGLSGANPLQKSLAPPQGEQPNQISKSQIMNTLTDRHVAALEKGDRAQSSMLRDAIIKFDSTNQIDPNLLEEAKASLAS